MSAEVTREDVLRVAELANLELTADEVPRMQRDLNAILGHIAQLSELDTSTVPPMAQVADVLDAAPIADGSTLRPDIEAPCLDRKVVMSQAPETDGRFFKVPKVIER
ncbi:MAG TPA: Asp-tRNA(Asn)/Glu-tRNA(Gln) amidotransferase subunit GatC [Acidobacteriaceae bacterium]|nr:Asp-tRNA(Asn)/Glu-tRNA(Gln) amidotransferase subunit GatC [Acidobacteriaceae bacterium]